MNSLTKAGSLSYFFVENSIYILFSEYYNIYGMNDQIGTLKETTADSQPFQISEIPFPLRELEVPKGYITAYVVVPKEQVESVANMGLVPQNPQHENPKVDEIFQKAAERFSVTKPGLSRQNSIFAIPQIPGVNQPPRINDHQALLEISFNPNSKQPIYVVDDISYVEGAEYLDPKQFETDDAEGSTEGYAIEYWRDAVTLPEYLQDQQVRNKGKKPDERKNGCGFYFPQILLHSPVVTTNIRVAPSPKIVPK